MFPRRFFAPEAARLRDIWLDRGESHHLMRVLRLPRQARVEVFDGMGHAFTASFVEADGAGRCRLLRGEPLRSREPPIRLTVGLAVLKGDAFTATARRLAEVGAASLTPLMTERSLGRASSGRVARWRAAVLSGARQCGRAAVPVVGSPQAFAAWISSPLPRERWIACPAGGNRPPARPDGSRRAVAIGPEGGFSPDEVRAASESGFRRLLLGDRVLRSGTAAVVASWALLGSGEEPEGHDRGAP